MSKKEEKYSDDEIIDIEADDLSSVTEADLREYMDPLSVFDTLNITEKTAFLWQYKPVPEDEPEPFDEYSSSEEDFDGGRITAARVRGKKHKHDGTNCDDWYEYGFSGKWKILAVSDGAGSKKFSRIGAKEACLSSVSYLKEKLSEISDDITAKLSLPLDDPAFMEGCGSFASMLQDAVINSQEAVKSAFEERKTKFEYLKILDRDLELKDFSATFLICIIYPVMIGENKEYFAASVQVGDGIICSIDRNSSFEKALRLLSQPDNGAYSGETEFITSESMGHKENLMGKTKIMRGRSSAFMLMTDGVADDYFPNSPELLRLYLDLQLNGIIDTVSSDPDASVPENIPEPLSYPWVNDNEQKISVQYSGRITEITGETLESLWNSPGVIDKASLISFGTELPDKRSERLKRWLDNYTERGSFDDRTLLICEME